ITVYPQQEVLKDLIAARLAAGGPILFEVRDVSLDDVEGSAPRIRFTTAEGQREEIACDFIGGCDGSHGVCRSALPAGAHREYFRAYPFGWLGLLAEAEPSAPELVYARHERGFALLSTRSPRLQRLYLQCEPEERAEDWSDDRIWAELRARVAGEGLTLREGPI